MNFAKVIVDYNIDKMQHCLKVYIRDSRIPRDHHQYIMFTQLEIIFMQYNQVVLYDAAKQVLNTDHQTTQFKNA